MHILVVEDDPVLADALTHSLRSLGYAVDCLMTGTEADRALSTDDYDLVILDIELPRMDGLEVLRRMRDRKQNVPVLVLTARDAVHDRIHGLDLGADDYLTKPFVMGELEARMRALMRRAQGASDNLINIGQLAVDLKGRRALINGVSLDLSAREQAVLEVLASRAGRVVSKEALIHSLYELDKDVGPNVIEIHVHRLRKKLQDSGVVIRTVRGLGYLMEPAGIRAHVSPDAE
ncbi:MAG: response regulator transcription factor [Betaproteobacteria bacterium]|nr:response regulator transcription factor [Betaproteobacteria bacterium]